MDNITITTGFQNSTGFVTDNNVYVVSAIFHLAASVASIFGNLLVIISVIKFRYLRETAHTLVTLLACFDLGIGVTGLVEQCIILLTVYKGDMNGLRIFCLITVVILSGLSTGDLLSVMFITIDRFIYITYPLRYTDLVTRIKVTFAVIFTVLYSLITSIILVLTTESIQGHIVCNLTQIISQFHISLFYVEGTVFALVLIIFYGKVAHLACKKVRQVYTENTQNSTSAHSGQQENTQNRISGENKSLQQQLKVTRLISLIIGVFFATNMCLVVTFIFFTDAEPTSVIVIQLAAEWIWKVRILLNVS